MDIESKIKQIVDSKALAEARKLEHEIASNQINKEFAKRKIRALIKEYAKFLCDWLEVECTFNFACFNSDAVQLEPHEITFRNFCIPRELRAVAEFYESLDDSEKTVWRNYMLEQGYSNDLIITYDAKDARNYRNSMEAASDDTLTIKF